MSILLDQITKDLTTARLARDKQKADVLRVIIGETQRTESKEVTDADIKAILEKSVKNNKIILKHNPGDEKTLYETALLKQYLPPEVSDDELREIKINHPTIGVGPFISLAASYAASCNKTLDRELAAQIYKE